MILRIQHRNNFTTISNSVLRDKRLSWKARGLLAFFLSHSDGYQIRSDNLRMFSEKDGNSSISSGIKELKQYGYMSFKKNRNPITNSWEAGEWIISEESSPIEDPLTHEKPDHGKPAFRETLIQGNRMPFKKNQVERNTKYKERTIKRRSDRFADNDKFDPTDLPAHLGNNEAIHTAWGRFVQSRREKKQKITPTAFKMLIKKMCAHSPEEIVIALDKSSERGYAGVFFPDDHFPGTRTPQCDPYSSIQLTDEGQQLLSFATSVLGNDIIRPSVIENLVQQMHVTYDRASSVSIPYYPDKHPNDHFSWSRFFKGWIEFLEKKQQSGFVLQSVRNLEQSDRRWREYMQYCAFCTNHDWATGKHI